MKNCFYRKNQSGQVRLSAKGSESGQALALAIIAVGLVLANSLVILNWSSIFHRSALYAVRSSEALNLAEAGVDKAIASLNRPGSSYTGESEVILGAGSYSVTVTTAGNNKIIESTGYVPSKENPKSKRTVKIIASKGTGTSFNYGVQVGEGGLQMGNSSTVDGSVYSNGNILMTNNARITGDAFVAGGTAAAADQSSVCTAPDCTDFIFGKSVSGSNRLDVAQSFKPSTTQIINKVSLNIKKIGSPPDITVRLLGDNNGSPNKNNVIASGGLSASLVGTGYSFVEVAFTTSPTLITDTTYWIMLDTSSNSSNYWSWSSDNIQSYSQGTAKWSSNWQASSPVWNSVPLDFDFKTYMGGVATYIQGDNGAVIGGSAHANTLRNLSITGDAYYQSIVNSTVSNSSCPNSHCHPGSQDPPPVVMPISEANIQEWKDEAEEGGIQTGNIDGCPSRLSRKKYVGNIKLTNGCITAMESPIWITGTLELDNGAKIKLDSNYGESSGVIIADGTITLKNNGTMEGSGTDGSYLIALTTFDSRSNGNTAILADNGSSSVVLYANYGKVFLSNNATLREVTSWKITMDNNSRVTYQSGLAGMFVSSPSGAYTLMKGTYQLK